MRFQTIALKHALLRKGLKQTGDIDNVVTEEVSRQDKTLWNAQPADSRYEDISPVVGQDKRISVEAE